MMVADQIFLGFVWVACLVFALTNGLHDAGAVVSPVIASRAASPRLAVGLSAIASLAGANLGGQAVSRTFSSLIRVSPADGQLLPILSAAVLGCPLEFSDLASGPALQLHTCPGRWVCRFGPGVGRLG